MNPKLKQIGLIIIQNSRLNTAEKLKYQSILKLKHRRTKLVEENQNSVLD